MAHERLQPATLFKSAPYGFSQVVKAQGGAIIYCAGQTAWDAEQNIVGANDFGAQTRKTLANVGEALAVAGAAPSDVISLRIFVVDYDVSKLEIIPQCLIEFFGSDNLPANTLLGVDKLALPEFMIEIEAMAVIS